MCRQYKIPLYLDGARMGYGLASRGSGMTLADLVDKQRRIDARCTCHSRGNC